MILLCIGMFTLMQVVVVVLSVSMLSDKISQVLKFGAVAANGMSGIPWEVGEGWVLVRNNRDKAAGAIVESGLEVECFHAGLPFQPFRTEPGSTFWSIAPGDHLLFHVGPNRLAKQNVRPTPFFLVHFTARADLPPEYPGVQRPPIDQRTPEMELHTGSWIIDLANDSDGWLQEQITTYRFLDRRFCATLEALGYGQVLPRFAGREPPAN